MLVAGSGVVLDCPWVKNRLFEGKAAFFFCCVNLGSG